MHTHNITYRLHNLTSLRRILTIVIIFAILLAMPAIVRALDASHYAPKSVLADGKWVKIRVSGPAMQRLTYSQLKTMGFSDPEKVRVYGYGGNKISELLNDSQIDDLPMIPTFRNNDALCFYAVGTIDWVYKGGIVPYAHQRNVYSDESYYFLSDKGDDDAPQTIDVPVGDAAKRVESFTELILHEKELVSIGSTGAELLGEEVTTTQSRKFSFPLPGQVIGSDVAYKVAFAMQPLRPDDKPKYSYLNIPSNGTSVSGNTRIPFSAIDIGNSASTHAVSKETMIKATGIDGRLDLSMSVELGTSSSIGNSRLNYIEVAYDRELKLEGGELLFNINVADPANQVIAVKGCDANTVIWDVTTPHRPCEVKHTLSGSTALFAPQSTGNHRYVVFSPAQVAQTPVKVSNQANQNIHAMAAPDMLIISLSEYKAQAERIADMHERLDGMSVTVLTPEDIYSEFSSGVPDVSAFRKVMKMWHDRTPGQLKYCLLMGRPTYDQRALTDAVKRHTYPHLLTWESPQYETEGSSYCTDNFIGMLDDDTSSIFIISSRKINVAVGRMPVKSVTEARLAVDKLLNYVENPERGAWRNNVMLVADDADNAIHLDQAQTMYSTLRRYGDGADFLYERLYLDSYPTGTGTAKTFPMAKERFQKMLKDGVSMINYIGHANPTSWTAEQFLNYSDITGVSNTRLPIFMTYTCEFLRFDADAISGAEIMWLHPTAGAIAFIAANRQVYMGENGSLNEQICANYYKRDDDGLPRRLGDIFRLGMNATSGSSNNLRYAIVGDPAMRIASPTHKVVIDSFAGVDTQAIGDVADYPVIPACGSIKVKGHIESADGTTVSNFKGKIAAVLYDAERVIETYGHNSVGKSDGAVRVYNDRKNRLFNGTFNVTDGQWEIELLLPFEIDNNYTPGLLNLYAWDNDNGFDAGGSTEQFYVYGWNSDMAQDIIDPDISMFALNSESFRDGSVVSASPVAIARVYDDSGINISTSGIGHQMTLTLDGGKVYTDVSDFFTTDADDCRGGSITYPLADIDEGDHSLQLTVWDNAGNSSVKELKFRVLNNAAASIQNIVTNVSPAKTDVTFYINHTISAPHLTTRIDIYDISGRRVWSDEVADTSQVTWDLNDLGGHRVARGIYICRATISTPDGTQCRASRKIAVAAP